MASMVSTIIQSIGQEIEHAQSLRDTFLRAGCLLELYYHRPSPLLGLFPDLRGQTLTDEEAGRLQQVVMLFIEQVSAHSELTGAVMLLALAHDRSLKEFFVAQLRRHLGWRKPGVVFHLLLALEGLGERVFYDAKGGFIGSRSADDTDTNFPVAQRYLERYDPDG
jgi:hypothetical protein